MSTKWKKTSVHASTIFMTAELIILILLKMVNGETSLHDNSCVCETTELSKMKPLMAPVSEWSPCREWPEESGETVGCYSGIQERKMMCSYIVFENVTRDIGAPNNSICVETRRCRLRDRECDGYWGQWDNNGPCNCATNKRTQSRYCNKKISVDKSLVSIHCFGSGGKFEQNRTMPCSSRKECGNVSLTSQTHNARTPFTESTDVRKDEKAPTTAGNGEASGVKDLGTQTLIIAGVAVGIAFLAMVMLAITCLMRKKQENSTEKSNNDTQQPPPPPPVPLSYPNTNDTLGAAHSVYRGYPHNESESYTLPIGAYGPMRRTVHTTHDYGRNKTLDTTRGRSATVAVNNVLAEVDPPYNTLRQENVRSSRGREEQYAVPIDHISNDDDEIYWSIDEIGLAAQAGATTQHMPETRSEISS